MGTYNDDDHSGLMGDAPWLPEKLVLSLKCLVQGGTLQMTDSWRQLPEEQLAGRWPRQRGRPSGAGGRIRSFAQVS